MNRVKDTGARTCPNGHRYINSSDCPVCPVCEKEREPAAAFLKKVAAPARRALEREGIITLDKLAQTSEMKLRSLHGVGPRALEVLKKLKAE